MKDQKDLQLNELFRKYVEEEPLPNKSVTSAALNAMRAQKVEQTVSEAARELAVATANGGSVGRSFNRKYVYIAAVAVLVTLLAVGCAIVLTRESSLPVLSDSHATEIDYEMLTENDVAVFSKQRIPFVDNAADVFEYKEFSLADNYYALDKASNDPDSREVVLCSASLMLSGNVEAKVFVEQEGYLVKELSRYKEAKHSQWVENNVFYYNIDKEEGKTYIYFRHDSNGYNMELFITEKERVFAVMNNVFGGFA